MSSEPPARRAIAFAAWAVVAVAVVVVLEAFSFLALSAMRRQWFTYARQQDARAAVATGTQLQPAKAGTAAIEAPSWIAPEVIHPYLGFVLDRAIAHPCRPELDGYRDALEYGFPCSDAPLIQKRSSDTVIVGIFGGSVAAALPAYGTNQLIAELGRVPAFAGKRIRIASLGIPGYKQPQQLMTLAYFLTLGAEFDVVVNLDGFNEIALPATENVPKGVFPFFPRDWFFRTGSFDPSTRREMGEVSYLQERRTARALAFSRAPWRYSTTASLFWTLLDRADATRIGKVEQALLAAPKPERAYVTTGPTRRYASPDDIYRDSAEVWRRCSLQMHRLASANGATYFGFLQPNQYVPGSKVLSNDERRVALSERTTFQHAVDLGYPLLLTSGAELSRTGVRFHDMTQVFADVREPVYTDGCCHFSAEGYDILAHAMRRAIAADLVATPNGAPHASRQVSANETSKDALLLR